MLDKVMNAGTAGAAPVSDWHVHEPATLTIARSRGGQISNAQRYPATAITLGTSTVARPIHTATGTLSSNVETPRRGRTSAATPTAAAPSLARA